MQRYDDIATRAAVDHLEIFGAFHPGPEDAAPEGCGALLLLGPSEPGFWRHFSASPEAQDGQPHPMDRWSTHVITALAGAVGAQALFPFDGPPWHPFISWAKRSGRAWASPIGPLVHDTAGLMVSYRGALALPDRIDLPSPPAQSPCAPCSAPCRTACPVGALSEIGYDTDACHTHLDTPTGAAACLAQGCLARRACPVSQSYGRDPAQSGFHMRSFHP